MRWTDMTWIIIAIPFLLSAWLTWRVTNPAPRLYIVDHPNQRSLHARATPGRRGAAVRRFVGVFRLGGAGRHRPIRARHRRHGGRGGGLSVFQLSPRADFH